MSSREKRHFLDAMKIHMETEQVSDPYQKELKLQINKIKQVLRKISFSERSDEIIDLTYRNSAPGVDKALSFLLLRYV